MTLAKVRAGQPFRMTAEAFNAFVDAATAYQASRQGLGADGTAVTRQAGVIPVRNESGADQDRFAVLGLGDVLITPSENLQAFAERVGFRAVATDADQHRERFCILQEPIAAGALGRAMVHGVTPARIDMQSAADTHAAVVTGSSSLASGSDGSARILWMEPGTGPRWGVVQFPAGGGGGNEPNLVLQVTKPGHGWMIADVLRWDGSGWIAADAAVVGATDTLAVVGRIPDDDTALLVLWGLCCLDGLADHTDYWLDPAVPGSLTETKPDDTPILVLHHAQSRLCVVRPGGGGGSGSASRFADLTDVDVTSTPPADRQAALWDADAQRWKPRDVVLADPVAPHQVLMGPAAAPDAKPDFREAAVGDLAEVGATSVLANATTAAARPDALAATQDDRVLLRAAGTLQWLQVPTAVIADGAITDPKIASVSWSKVTGIPGTFPPGPHEHLLGGALTGTTANAGIADGAVTDRTVLSVSWPKITGAPASFPPAPHEHDLGGDLTGTTADAHIAPGAVGNEQLENDFLTIGGTDYHLGEEVTSLLANPMTSEGDLIVGGPSGAPHRLAGNPGGTLQVLTSKSGLTALTPLTLDALEDVHVSSPQDGDVLTYDEATSQWQSAPAGSSSSGHDQHPAFVATITGKAAGNLYHVTLYPQWPSTTPAWTTTATQLQGDPTKTIPANTWTIACGVRKDGQPGTAVGDYDVFIQVPVWM